MIIVVINGTGGCGKDTFVEQCQSIIHERCFNVSTVDFVKELAKQAGWDGTKSPENRKFLSDLKDLLSKWNNVPFNDVWAKIKNWENSMISYGYRSDELIAFIHSREPYEIEKFAKELGAKTLIIHRNGVDCTLATNHADKEVENYQYDYDIDNSGSISQLYYQAKLFLNQLALDTMQGIEP